MTLMRHKCFELQFNSKCVTSGTNCVQKWLTLISSPYAVLNFCFFLKGIFSKIGFKGGHECSLKTTRLGSTNNTRNKTKCKAICLQEVCLHTRLLGLSILMKICIHVCCWLVESRNDSFSTRLPMNFNERNKRLKVGNILWY